MTGLQKSGYLQVKQPSNIKGRKLKTWKTKWAILHKMSNISEGTFAAKLDLYNDEISASKVSQDKLTYIFENVSCIQSANSKTHKCAFEIVETCPVICLSSLVDEETVEWAKVFQYIFWPPPGPDGEDLFQVIIEENDDSRKYSLSGEYWMYLSPQELKIKAMSKAQMLSWKLSNLKRFNLDQKNSKILIIESGAKSDFGEAKFMFRSSNVLDIFQCIKKNIARAVEQRHRNLSTGSLEGRGRTSSASNSEKGFKMLLERSREDLNVSSDSIDSLSGTSGSTKQRTQSQDSLHDESLLGTSPPPKPPRLPPKADQNDGNHSSACYDELSLPSAAKVDAKKESPQIVSSEVIHDKENQRFIEVNHDKYGYSHIPCQMPQDSRISVVRSVSGYDDVDLSPTSEKNRVIPNRIDQSQDLRSGSVKSNDSGFVASPHIETSGSIVRQTATGLKANHKKNGSFDSAISTSSCVESISAAVNDVLIVTELSPGNKTYDNIDPTVSVDHSEIYSDIHSHAKHDNNMNEETETQYEDLEKYRKDLSKYLGMDPQVNPKDVPPSLPDRPTSLPIRRKEFKKKTKKSKSNRKVTFSRFLKERNSTHSRTASVTSTSSSSSVSDGEDESSIPKIPTFQMLKHMQKNTLYEQTNVENDQTNVLKVSTTDNPDIIPRRHSSDPVLMGMSQRRHTIGNAGYDEVKNEPKRTVSFDLLTGEILNDSSVETSDHTVSGILSPTSTENPNFPPVVEKLVNIDIPENKSPDIILGSATGTDDQLIFRSRPDGNFVWDPFPNMTKPDRPLIDFDSNQDLTSENKTALSPVTLDTTCYEIMTSPREVKNLDNLDSLDSLNHRSEGSPISTSTQNVQFVDNIDPFNIVSLDTSPVKQVHTRSNSFDGVVDVSVNNPSDVSNESPYMDMSRATPPVEDAYVAPSTL